ncbi:MAG: isoaspartyl peptidase/L-asparaginase [Caldisericaceae bacterium]|nr:isoaspartyl peptidase/L-asparaginase [Caldisericaceae bacterium]
MPELEPKLIVHGGAWDIPKRLHHEHLAGIEQALQLGQQVLKKEDDALKTVIEVIKFLEELMPVAVRF